MLNKKCKVISYEIHFASIGHQGSLKVKIIVATKVGTFVWGSIQESIYVLALNVSLQLLILEFKNGQK